MRVLVTGGDGFVGQNAVSALTKAGHSVLIAGRRAERKSSGYKVDLLNQAERTTLVKQANADALVHFAWETHPANFWNDPVNVDWALASYDLVQRFLDAGGTRAILAGSCAEYDWSAAERRLVENAPCQPTTVYGSCKLNLCRQCEQLISEGASIAWGRLFFLLGPREHPARFVPSIVRPLLNGRAAYMTQGSQIRDFLHVADAGRAFAALVDSSLDGVVNIASGVGVSLENLAKAAYTRIGRGELQLGALPTRPEDPPKLVADVRRLRNEVGFARSYDWRSALNTCVEYWRGAPQKHSEDSPLGNNPSYP